MNEETKTFEELRSELLRCFYELWIKVESDEGRAMDLAVQLDALIASVREDVLEEAAKACEGNDLVSGSIGPLMNVGWCSCQTACARAIRNLKGGS